MTEYVDMSFDRREFLCMLGALSLGSLHALVKADDSPRIANFLGPYFPYTDFASLPTTSQKIQNGTLRIAFVAEPGGPLTKEDVLQWIRERAMAVGEYFGALPGGDVKLLIVFADGSGIQGGSSFGFRGAASRVVIGKRATMSQLERDWVLVHELVHHAFPDVADRHHWMEEGLATYIEPIVRIHAGQMREDTMWMELMEGLPKGLPAAGDAGLDNTPTWGRTYWGGALFYFLTDIEIRRHTQNAKSLRDGLVALLRAGGNITQSWSVDRVIAAADQGSGTTAFRDTYDRMKESPCDVDLVALWRQLGVGSRAGIIVCDDTAPLAYVRRGIAAKTVS